MMKKRFILWCLLLLLIFPSGIFAQGEYQMREGASRSPRNCLPIADLDLTIEQRSAIQDIESRYDGLIKDLQNRLMGKRLEVQEAFRNPQADERVIREKVMEVSEIQNQCRQFMLDYQLAVRALLSPRQMNIWCTPMEPCIMRWTGKP